MNNAQVARAAAAAGTSGGPATQHLPPFLMKLWAIMEDPRNESMIIWSPNGQRFYILDDQKFAYQLLPKYFRHCNLSRFIRQLNLYGFKKIMTIQNGTLEAVSNSPLVFQHPHFIQGKPELLANIKRKEPRRKEPTPREPASSSKDLKKMLSRFRAMRKEQHHMSQKMDSITRGNKSLRREMAFLHQKGDQQNHTLSQILQIIMNWTTNSRGRLDAQRKRAQDNASEAPPAKTSHPQARSATEDRKSAAVPGPSTVRHMQGEAGGAARADNGQASVHEHCDNREILDLLNCFSANLLEIETLMTEKFNTITDFLNQALYSEQDLYAQSAGVPDGSLENMARNTGAIGMNVQEAPRRNDLQMIQNHENRIREEPPAFKVEYDTEVPPAILEDRPSVPFSGEAPEYLAPINQAGGMPTHLFQDQPFFFGNMYGDY